MSHDERLPECKEIQCEMKDCIAKHIAESVPVRSDVEKHNHQILTLMESRASTMADIKDIKTEISCINRNIESLNASVKIWVLSGICGTVMAFAIPTMVLFYNAGQMAKQVELNTKKWENQDAHDNSRHQTQTYKN